MHFANCIHKLLSKTFFCHWLRQKNVSWTNASLSCVEASSPNNSLNCTASISFCSENYRIFPSQFQGNWSKILCSSLIYEFSHPRTSRKENVVQQRRRNKFLTNFCISF